MSLAEIVAELKNAAKYGVFLKQEELTKLTDQLEKVKEDLHSQLLGQKVYICQDHNWSGVVTAVEQRLGSEVHFKVEWRDGRDFRERWFTKKELDAFGQLEEP